MFIDVLYHPPRPLYRPDSLLDYIQVCIDEINMQSSCCILGTCWWLEPTVTRWARRTRLHRIDADREAANTWSQHLRLYKRLMPAVWHTASCEVGRPYSDHQGVACTASQFSTSQSQYTELQKIMGTHRRITPTQHAIFLQYIRGAENQSGSTHISPPYLTSGGLPFASGRPRANQN